MILEVDELSFYLPLLKIDALPSNLSSRGFCLGTICYIEAEYTPVYLEALREIPSVEFKELDIPVARGTIVHSAKPITLESTNVVVEYATNHGILVLKSYRMLPEINTEVKILEKLAMSGYRYVPHVRALVYYGKRVVGVLMNKVIGEEDGGTPFYVALSNYLAGNRKSEKIGLASKLGVIIGEMHLALNKDAEDPYFGIEPVVDSDIEAWSKRIEERMDNALSKLDSTLSSATEEERVELEYWRDFAERTGLKTVEDAVSSLERSKDLFKGRIHQDLHLAQMVYTGNGVVDFVITDFEGEPGRSGSERYVKEPLIRDIASMVRSFHYLSHAAIMNSFNLSKHRTSLLMIEKDPSLNWRLKHVVAMTFSYLARVIGTGLLAHDETKVSSNIWLYLYPWIVERAVYEFYYESLYRPSWVSIPLAGLIEAEIYKNLKLGVK